MLSKANLHTQKTTAMVATKTNKKQTNNKNRTNVINVKYTVENAKGRKL